MNWFGIKGNVEIFCISFCSIQWTCIPVVYNLPINKVKLIDVWTNTRCMLMQTDRNIFYKTY